MALRYTIIIEHDRLIYRYAICDLSKTSHKVVGERIAGAVEKEITLKDNEAMYVTTGAALPRGTRAVVPIEQTKKSKDGIEINAPVKLNQWIRFRGSDLSKGDVAIPKGTQIEAAEIGLLAQLGVNKIMTYDTPRVGVLSTGNELVEKDDLRRGTIRDSNRPMLLAAVRQAGAIPIDLGLVKDLNEDLSEIFSDAMSKCDVIITSGGVSMGTHDLVKPTMKRLGATIHFGRLRMKPGKPSTFATLSRQGDKKKTNDLLLFGLPGNPCSSLVIFKLLVEPALRKMMGHNVSDSSEKVQVRLDTNISRDPVRDEYHRVTLCKKNNDVVATSTGVQRSSRLKSMQGADALVHVRSGNDVLQRGSVANAYVIRSSASSLFSGSSNSSDSAKAYAFDQVVEHLQWRNDVQNIDMMNLTGFCRNCLAKWFRIGKHKMLRENITYDEAREYVYGTSYGNWKSKYQQKASKEQMERFESGKSRHARHEKIDSTKSLQTNQTPRRGHSNVCCSSTNSTTTATTNVKTSELIYRCRYGERSSIERRVQRLVGSCCCDESAK